ncbi:hypothetical protein AshY1_03520 [Candidatus Phytoplasma fraxini]|uniref:Type I restriction modification DNA specificity domain-containing protein n=2 Tax=Ash yellows phytoplasma TaxID=35780 RepID=A0ABZ2U8C9_ASHYP
MAVCIPDKHIFEQIKCYTLSEFIPRQRLINLGNGCLFYTLYSIMKDTKKATSHFLKFNLPTIPPLTSEQQKKLLILGNELLELHLNYEKITPSMIYQEKDKKPDDYIPYHKDMSYVP